jgi:hypothetical protein|uniref:Uncharacterized protein n=1 Tax=Myoviridae sp. ctqMr7 TaxID=2823552 RepID=A0A8S5LH99_9CAUD|nr:MAG TPA: protein of unknown function DUF4907 [Myoviridae sp. ctqMr7]
MKKYRLKKNLPYAKAGEIFDDQYEDGILTFYHQNKTIDIYKKNIDNFDEWFEEVKETETFEVPDEYYIPIIYADKIGITTLKIGNDTVVHQPLYINSQSVGLAFKTEEEAERHIKYLKAKAIIKQDTNGFKPNWNNENESKYYGYWDSKDNKPYWYVLGVNKVSDIFFKSSEDIKESFAKHPEEWKTYLTYDQ